MSNTIKTMPTALNVEELDTVLGKATARAKQVRELSETELADISGGATLAVLKPIDIIGRLERPGVIDQINNGGIIIIGRP